jgi:hypothetical protein
VLTAGGENYVNGNRLIKIIKTKIFTDLEGGSLGIAGIIDSLPL